MPCRSRWKRRSGASESVNQSDFDFGNVQLGTLSKEIPQQFKLLASLKKNGELDDFTPAHAGHSIGIGKSAQNVGHLFLQSAASEVNPEKNSRDW